MRVAIGAAVNPTGGPARYARELAAALGASGGDGEYVVLTNRPMDFAGLPGVRMVHVPLASAALEPWWDHVLVPAAVRRYGIDVYHGIKGAVPLYRGCAQVVTIHDLAIYAYPGTFAWLQHLHMRPHLRLAACRADRVIADSEHARRDLMERLSLPADRVVAVPLGVRAALFSREPGKNDDSVAERLGLPPRFLLYAGTIQPRKNIGIVVQAFAEMNAAPDWALLLAGRCRPGYRPPWMSAPPAGVRYLGAVPDEDLAVLYRRAAGLVSPSSYEGFGLTLLEAMASGCPTIAAAVSSVPEVVGDAGVLLEAVDPASVRDAMARLVRDAAMREELSRRGWERAQEFSWAETARRTRAVYREALGHA